MKLNKQVELGMSVLAVLKKYNTPTRTVDLADEIGTTQNFLEQIMRKLRIKGLVVSVRGAGGGYVLARTKHPTTARDVAEAMGHSFEIPEDRHTAVSRLTLNKLNEAITKAFENIAV